MRFRSSTDPMRNGEKTWGKPSLIDTLRYIIAATSHANRARVPPSLHDGRAVYLDGERVTDVTTHPAFAEPIRQVATRCTRSGARALGSRHDDVRRTRRRAAARLPCGSSLAPRPISRSAATFTVRGRSVRSASWDARPTRVLRSSRGLPARPTSSRGAVSNSPRTCFASTRGRGDEDLFIPYAVVPPQGIARSPLHKQREPFLYCRRGRERDDGIVLPRRPDDRHIGDHGASLLVTYITPLVPGDEALRVLRHDPGQRGGTPHLSASSLQHHGHEHVRLPALVASTRSTPSSCSGTCSSRGRHVFIYRNLWTW